MDTTGAGDILSRVGIVLTGPTSVSDPVACPSSSFSDPAVCPPASSDSICHLPSDSVPEARPPKVHACGVCGKTFVEKKRRNAHEKECGGVDCDHCEKHFRSTRSLKEHINTAHNTNFRCFVCKKCFGGLSKLNRHMPSHDDNKRVECEKCGKVFKRKDNLTRHMKIHS